MLRFLHFYPSQQKTLALGKRVRVRGEARGGFFGLEMVHPSFKVVTPSTPLPTRADAGLPEHGAAVAGATCARRSPPALARADLDEILPPASCRPGLPSAARGARPACTSRAPGLDCRGARGPLASGLAAPQVRRAAGAAAVAAAGQARARAAARAGVRGPRAGGLHDALLAALPFALTAAQRRVARRDRGRPRPRACRCTACCRATSARARRWSRRSPRRVAIDAGWQCALMAPTEILAEQHLKKLVGWLAPLGVTVAWLTGSRKGKAREAMLAQVASGEAGAGRRHARGDRGAGAASPGSAWRSSTSSIASASPQRLALREQAGHGTRIGRSSSRTC